MSQYNKTMSTHTFLWHDYETFGAQPRRDRPAQFAAIRTDAELNEIGEPLMLFCQPANDYLPDPQSCLITGITPQQCLELGVPEHEFARQIEAAFAEPGTIGVGYNTIRFDDEVTRFLFWRNLLDPYAREWQNNCGRWDLLDVVRMTYALRPEGIEWPTHPDGRPSFRLEDLTRANGLSHEAAHDALSDVRATIALARLIRNKQPRLFDFCLELRRKDKVASEMGLHLERGSAPALPARVGHVPGRARLPGPGLAAGPASEQQERNPGVGLPSRSVGTVRPGRRDDPPAHVHAQRRPAGRRDAPADQERTPE
jgi:exodeoxyribonuclease-1